MFLQLLITFLVSMVPLIELRGAIPIGIAIGGGAPDWLVLLVAAFGNMLPVPFIYWFSIKVLDWGSAQNKIKWFRKFCRFCLNRGEKLGQKLLAKVHGGVYVALFLYVALPIPGTGAWTATLASALLKLDFRKTVIAVMGGVLVAGLIMLFASLGLFRLVLGQ